MLLSKRCPHTGVVNFYDASEPHIAIGSINKRGVTRIAGAVAAGYTWHYHADDALRSGHAPDVRSAERDLRAMLFKSSSGQSGVSHH